MDDKNDLKISPEEVVSNGAEEISAAPPASSFSPDDQASNASPSQNSAGNVLKGVDTNDSAIENTDEPSEVTVKKANFQQLSAVGQEKTSQNIELLMDVDLPVSIELGRAKMNIADILSLGPGSVVELDKLVGEPVDLLVNQKCVARGEVVVVEENFGLRITQLISPEERVKNLQ
ncbi:MAG: flagellar motor switch protein FliN [candidate division Zixibacteria bacterium]|nr:flagellar motor switch protein FliN [candidate division Zixibacteria bacterium]